LELAVHLLFLGDLCMLNNITCAQKLKEAKMIIIMRFEWITSFRQRKIYLKMTDEQRRNDKTYFASNVLFPWNRLRHIRTYTLAWADIKKY